MMCEFFLWFPFTFKYLVGQLGAKFPSSFLCFKSYGFGWYIFLVFFEDIFSEPECLGFLNGEMVGMFFCIGCGIKPAWLLLVVVKQSVSTETWVWISSLQIKLTW